jgi:hypothetical protein
MYDFKNNVVLITGGRYEDELVKRNGEWPIAKRRRIE